MWLGLPTAWRLGSERECPKSKSLKRQEGEAARSVKGIDSPPSYSVAQRNHRVSPDSKGWRHRLDGWVAGRTGEDHVGMTAIVVAIFVAYTFLSTCVSTIGLARPKAPLHFFGS